MAIIEIPIGAPYGTVPVNTLTVYAVLPHPAAPQSSTDLLIDSAGARSIQALLPIDEVGRMLGNEFAEFTLAHVSPEKCFVNRTTWVSIVPHPQIDGVVQINFANHYTPVRGTVPEVLRKLQVSPEMAGTQRAGIKRPRSRGRKPARASS
jgi:hypothetical protein